MTDPTLLLAAIQGTSSVIKSFVDAVAQVSTPIRLAAFAVTAVLALVLLQRRRVTPSIAWGGLAVVGLLAVIPLVAQALLASDARYNEVNLVYRLRVTVLGLDGLPSKPDRIWASLGGEPQQVSAGWMFVFPRSTLPASRAVTVYARRDETCEYGTVQHVLDSDANPEVTLTLRQDSSADVVGTVRDESDVSIPGAQVFVEGHGDQEIITTNSVGAFRLPAHASRCAQVRVTAQKEGYQSATEYVYPGNPVLLTLLSHQR